MNDSHDPFLWDQMEHSIYCRFCRHMRDLMELTCDAFPHGIPEDIRSGRFIHIKPFPSQEGNMVFHPW